MIQSFIPLISSIIGIILTGLSVLEKHNNLTGSLGILLTGTLFAAIAAFFSIYTSRRIKSSQIERRIFIVYARKDIETAKEVANLLRKANLEPWLDIDNIVPGQIWKDEINRAMASSGAAIILISEHLMAGNYSRHEMDMLLKGFKSGGVKSIPIIPVRIDDTTPPDDLSEIQWLDFWSENSRDKLLKGIMFVTRNKMEYKENGIVPNSSIE